MDWVELLTNLRNRERGMDLARMIPQELPPLKAFRVHERINAAIHKQNLAVDAAGLF